mgnify:CR=1 FL=1|jgi:hypothetical protein|tara:strand:+ start:840 stop:1025 length:186 start_codon:yes stop_codon:yes gene_type:complete
MPLSDRLNDLLDWWTLRIEKAREDTKEKDDTSNDIPSTVSTSNTVGTVEDARLSKEKKEVK